MFNPPPTVPGLYTSGYPAASRERGNGPIGRGAALAVKPGRYNVRFSAHSVGLGRSWSVYTDVIVPEFGKDTLSLSGLVVAAEPTLIAAPKDAFASIVPVVPTTKRDFDRSDRGSAFVRIYTAEARREQAVNRVVVTARVTNAANAVVATRADEITADRFTPSHAADYTYELPLAALAPGPYLLTIDVAAAGHTARRDVRFSVR